MCRVGQKTVFLRIFPIYNTFLVKFTTLQTGSPKKNVQIKTLIAVPNFFLSISRNFSTLNSQQPSFSF